MGGLGFYLFQHGGTGLTHFSKKVKSAGGQVQVINSVEDFMNKTIKFTKDLYGEVV